MYAQIGEIQFEGIFGFSSFDLKRETNLVEHSLIDGKPRLQRLGSALDEVNVVIRLHKMFCDPETEYASLDEYRENGVIVPLIWGNGRVLGDFLVRKIGQKMIQQDGRGNIIAVDIDLTLVEYYDSNKISTLDSSARREAFALSDNRPQLVARVSPPNTDVLAINAELQSAQGAASSLDDAVRGGQLTPTPNTFSDALRAANKARLSMTNAIGRINQSSADLQTRANVLRSDLSTSINLLRGVEIAAQNNDFAAMQSANTAFQSGMITVGTSGISVASLAAIRRNL